MKNETNYLYELDQQGLLEVMEQEFEKQYPATKATFTIDSNNNFIRIAIFDRTLRLMNVYYVTVFDCVACPSSVIELLFKDHPRSDKPIQDSIVKNFYLGFMKKHFESYEKDRTHFINSRQVME